MPLEIILILILIVLNGFFSGAEIAIITLRKTKVTELEKAGNKNAHILHRLKSEPVQFLAAVQIGVTVVGALAAALGGALAVKTIKPAIERIPVEVVSQSSEAISIGIVVVALSYLSLVFGELAPKTIALRSPERVSLLVARPMLLFSRVTSLFIAGLSSSTNFVLKIFGVEPRPHSSFITEEEIKLFIKEGRDRGFFEPDEEKLLSSVFEFADLSVKEIMVPLTKVTSFSLEAPVTEILHAIGEEQFSRYPVHHRERSNIKGILYAKDLFRKLANNEPIDVRRLLRTPLFIPESMKISALLREMQRKGVHMAMVVDEYGTVNGIVTMEDVIEEIVGEIRDEFDVEQPVIRLKDGSFLIDASLATRDLKEDYGIALPESPDYETVGGFIIAELQRIPASGEKFQIQGWTVSIVQMVGKRISRVILAPLAEPEENPRESSSPPADA